MMLCFELLRYWLLLLIIIEAVESRSSRASNHDLLQKIGLNRVKTLSSHHRKRLAVESRHHTKTDDSHVFIIKLPPSPHYYSHNSPNAIYPPTNNLPIGFKSNGKPSSVYHWNIPVVSKHIYNKYKKLKGHKDDRTLQNRQNWNDVLEKKETDTDHRVPIYYVPAKSKQMSLMKDFPGNGKPHSFYVLERSKKGHYHRLLP